jgi:tetratricopeptide (TPR) repeat protein
MTHPHLEYLARRRRTRIAAFIGAAIVVVGSMYYLSSGSREYMLSKADLSTLERAVAQAPEDDELNYRFAYVLTGDGQVKRAIEIVDRLVRKNPKSAQYRFGLARAKEVAGRNQEAVGDYLKAIELDKDLTLAHLGVASIYARAGLATESIRHYDHINNLKQNGEGDDVGRAKSYMALGRTEDAYQLMLKNVHAQRMMDQFYPILIESGIKLGHTAELEPLLYNRLANTPIYPVFPVRIGLLRIQLAKPRTPEVLTEMKHLASKGFTASGVVPEFMAINAEVLLVNKEIAEARNSAKEGLNQEPDNVPCLRQLAKIEALRGDKNAAEALEKRIQQLTQHDSAIEKLRKESVALANNVAGHKRIANEYMAMGEAALANEECQKIASQAPSDPEVSQLLERSRMEALRIFDTKSATASIHPSSEPHAH